jgi:hypothetical protein
MTVNRAVHFFVEVESDLLPGGSENALLKNCCRQMIG